MPGLLGKNRQILAALIPALATAPAHSSPPTPFLHSPGPAPPAQPQSNAQLCREAISISHPACLQAREFPVHWHSVTASWETEHLGGHSRAQARGRDGLVTAESHLPYGRSLRSPFCPQLYTGTSRGFLQQGQGWRSLKHAQTSNPGRFHSTTPPAVHHWQFSAS